MPDIMSTLKNTSRKPYIYKVTNFETGQYYIGSQCSGKTIGVDYFTSSWNKEFKEDFKNYGGEKYEITIIKEFSDPKECIKAENYIIRNFMKLKDNLCLNRAYVCNNKKIFSRIGLAPWCKGRHLSEEHKKKLSGALKGHHIPDETKRKISTARKGTPLTEATKQKMSITLKGRHLSAEIKQKMSLAHKGTHLSEEYKKKLSEAAKRQKISIGGNFFNSITEAARSHNVSGTTIRYWVKKNKYNAFYIKK